MGRIYSRRPLGGLLAWLMRFIWAIYGLAFAALLVMVVIWFAQPDLYRGYFPTTVEYRLNGNLLRGETNSGTSYQDTADAPVVSLEGERGLLIIRNPPASIVIPTILRIFVKLFLIGAILLMVHRLVFSYVNDHPFDPGNAKRFTAIGWLILAKVAIDYAGHVWIQQHLAEFVGMNGSGFYIHASLFYISFWTVMLAFLMFMLGEIFRRGTYLQQENELTV